MTVPGSSTLVTVTATSRDDGHLIALSVAFTVTLYTLFPGY